MLKRIVIFLINIFFPPVSVCLLAGPETDCAINCALFLCGVIPSHIHGFYISFVYFGRKRKVRKGRWPGARKPGIYSERVQTGGAGWAEWRRLKKTQEGGGGGGEKLDRRISRADANRQWPSRSNSAYGRDGVSRQPSSVSQRNSRAGVGEPLSPVSQRSGTLMGEPFNPVSHGNGTLMAEPFSPIPQRDGSVRDAERRQSRRQSQRMSGGHGF